jgi:tRNA nucleotidyltransferase (CCA-adding enzyme)
MEENALKIYNGVEAIIGQPLYLVGGSIRDILLNKIPKDYDFTTPLQPEEIEQKIKDIQRRAYLTGKRFGTIGVKVEGQLVEITTFRTEKYIPGSRKPEVEFITDINEDLSRRDFTINAIAMGGKTGDNFVDPFNGIEDLKNRIIKAVGNPVTRFREDPLRLLRAVRFASQLGFTIELKTLNAITKKNYKILQVSRERWMLELDKILLTDKPSVGLDYLAYTHLLHFMLPELALQVNYEQNSPWHKFDLWTHTKLVVDGTPKDINLRWAALLHDIAKPFVRRDKIDRSNYIKHDMLGAEIVERYADYLKWSNDRKKNVKDLVKYHMQDESPLRDADGRGH